MDLNIFEQNVTARSFLTFELLDLQRFMFSDRYHLTVSALARVSPSTMGLMVWITSFNGCRTSILLLLWNVFLKVGAVYFIADSTISGVFQCSACLVGHSPLAPTPLSISQVLMVHSLTRCVHPALFDVIIVWQGMQEPSRNFLKTLRQPSQNFSPKIITSYFFHSNLYLDFLRPCCENIFKNTCLVSEKIGN